MKQQSVIPVDLPWLESGGLEPRLKIKFSPNLVAFYQLLGLGVCGAGDVCKRWALGAHHGDGIICWEVGEQ